MNFTSPTQLRTNIDTANKTCIRFPPKVNSAGIWENQTSPQVILGYSLPLLELEILVMFITTQALHFVFKQFGLRPLVSQIVAGFVLGRSLLGKVESFRHNVFPRESKETFDTVVYLGFCIFLFLTGVKTDVGMAFRAAKRATVIGVASIFFPLVVTTSYHLATRYPDQSREVKAEHYAILAVESNTSFTVIACLLNEIKILNSELGRLALSSAIVGDFCSLFLMSLFTFMRISVRSRLQFGKDFFGMISYTLVTIFVLRPVMTWMVRRTPEGKPVKDSYIYAVLLMALGSALCTHYCDHTPLFGVFVFGLAVPDGPPLGSTLVRKFESFVSLVFFPLFVCTTAIRADPSLLTVGHLDDRFSIMAVFLSFVGKFASTLAPPLYCKMPWKDATALALIMSSKGIIELSYFSTLQDRKVIRDKAFVVVVLGVLLNVAVVPLLIKILYDPFSRKYAGYQRRNIMHLKNNAEFKILACVHRPENVSAFIGLLDATGPTKASPNMVYVLHLIELIGRASPVFIAHQKRETKVVRHSFESVVLAFNQYEQCNWGLVTVNAFTAISPTQMMHEDICTLAFDKQASFILLPFHRKWAIDGSIESDSTEIRSVNCTVLDGAPCSIGILVDRGIVNRLTRIASSNRSATPSYSVGIIFFGGKDDRESLALAKRMANDHKVKLTVIHFVSRDDPKNFIDGLLDDEALRNVRQTEYIKYIEQEVKDGPQTAFMLRSVVEGYDLLIVGRRYGIESTQTSGLSEWSEFPEIGIIGDLLASPDMESKTSVLVVQQQRYVDVQRG